MKTDYLTWQKEPALQIGLVIKVVGYALFLRWWFKLGIYRSVMFGMGRAFFGAATALFLLFHFPDPMKTIPFYLCLVVVRAVEWMVLGKLVDGDQGCKQLIRFMVVALLISVLLDLPVLLGWVGLREVVY